MKKYYFYEMNSFHRVLLMLSVVCVISGCDSPDKKNSHHRASRTVRLPKILNFCGRMSFLLRPSKVEGCVGLYTYDSLNIAFDSLDVDKGKKVLVTKTNEFAFFRLHQKDIYLQYDSCKERADR